MKKSSTVKLSADTIPLLVADVYQLAGAFRRWGDSIASKVGQTQAHWQVISAASVGNRTVAQLARRLGLARQSVLRTADLLVADGIAEYVSNADHQRSPHLRLTRRGNELLDTLTKAADAYHRKLAEELTVKELETALAVIRKLCAQIDRDITANSVDLYKLSKNHLSADPSKMRSART